MKVTYNIHESIVIEHDTKNEIVTLIVPSSGYDNDHEIDLTNDEIGDLLEVLTQLYDGTH